MLKGEIKKYWHVRNELNIINDLLVRGTRIIIPAAERKHVLELLHCGHLGIVKCCERARNSVWWPHINQAIHEMVNNCRKCAEVRVNFAEPLITTILPKKSRDIL